jgi:N utilization substance protein B
MRERTDEAGPRKDFAPSNARSAARLAAVQGLYQMDLAQTDLNAVIDEFISHRFTALDSETAVAGADATFFTELLRGVVRRQRDIDPLVDQQLATGWRLARVDSILRAALRAGVFELLERLDVPPRVVITEYVEVAKAFFEGDEPKVVNAVLDKLARKLRSAELERGGRA